MNRRKLIQWLRLTILALICGACLSIIPSINASKSPVTTPEEIFADRVLDGRPVPTQVTRIQAIEGLIAFGYSNGPALVRFEATDAFITELTGRDYGIYGAYAPVPCEDGPIKDDLVKNMFRANEVWKANEWWKPSEVASPICYHTSTCVLYDNKHLLIDPDRNVGYFYRTPTCRLCPGGLEGQALRESPRCQ